MNNNVGTLKSALGLSLSVIATEHMFSAGLSSPWSVDKFTETQADKDKFWRLFWWAVAASIIFAVIIAWMLQDYWALIGTGAVIAFYWYEYHQAVNHQL